MAYVENAATLPVVWWKSSASGTQSDCVECGVIDARTIAVRDSKAPTGPALLISRRALTGLVAGVKSGVL